MQNPQTVDLLVSLAFTSAGEGTMDDPLPIGMGLRVPLSDAAAMSTQTSNCSWYRGTRPTPVPEVPKDLQPGPDGLVEFDELTREQVSCDSLPRCQAVLTLNA
jgi:ubiquitin-conjugating enzyme E2 Q